MPPKPPTVTVVIPSFNASAYLAATIESALAQSLPPLEVLVVDDGSTDDSPAIAESFGSAVQLFREQNAGVSAARNVGIAAARGEYLLFLDADDLLHPGALSTLCSAVGRVDEAVAVQMGYASFDTDPNQPTRIAAPTETAFFPALIRGNIGVVHTWLLPRSTVQAIGGFDPGTRIYQFWHFLAKVALTGIPMRSVDFIGAYYRIVPASMIRGAAPQAVARGHLAVERLLCDGFLGPRPDLLDAHGEVLFWASWVALHRAREAGVPWQERAGLARAVEQLARRGPASVRRSRFGRLVRLLGYRPAAGLQRLASTRASVTPT